MQERHHPVCSEAGHTDQHHQDASERDGHAGIEQEVGDEGEEADEREEEGGEDREKSYGQDEGECGIDDRAVGAEEHDTVLVVALIDGASEHEREHGEQCGRHRCNGLHPAGCECEADDPGD
ncbi:MAG: hypothetical protein LCH31_03215 [Actinobacteria bacterium]|nr:hypothetical protein [Actinomycetota bacterium]